MRPVTAGAVLPLPTLLPPLLADGALLPLLVVATFKSNSRLVLGCHVTLVKMHLKVMNPKPYTQ